MKIFFDKLKDFQTLIAVIIAAIIISVALLNSSRGSSEAFVDPDSYFSGKPVQDHELLFGNKDASVIVLEYADLDCTFCKQFAQKNFEDLKSKYSQDIAFVYRHLPVSSLHPEAALKSLYALCTLDQDKSKYATLIQDSYTKYQSSYKADHYLAFLKENNYDIDKINTCVDDSTYLDELQSNVQEAVDLGINSTPNFLILVKKDNKYQILTIIAGARNNDYFGAVIDQAIRIAR